MLVTLGVAPGVLRLRIRTDGHALIPPDSEAIRVDQSIREEFLHKDPVVVFITAQGSEGIFNAHTLALVQRLTDQFSTLPEFDDIDIFSLATEHGHRVIPGTLTFRRFLDPLPRTEKQLGILRDDLRAIKRYHGTLVSLDERSTAIFVGVASVTDRVAQFQRIRKIIEAEGDIPENIELIGAPVAEASLGTHLLEDLGVPPAWLGQSTRSRQIEPGYKLPQSFDELRYQIAAHLGLVPLAMGLICLVFVVCFRSLVAALLPMMEVGASLVFVFGMMGYCDVPIYLTIAVLPVILTAVGVADEIHIFTRYRQLLQSKPTAPYRSLIEETMQEMRSPIIKTSLTTMIGFLSFALSPIRPVQAFGIFTAMGVLFCMIWSLTVIPALLSLIDGKRLIPRNTPSTDSSQTQDASSCSSLVGLIKRKRRLIFVVCLLLILISGDGARRVVIQDSWIDGFSESSPFYQASTHFNEQFLGMHILLLSVEGVAKTQEGIINGDLIDKRAIHFPLDTLTDADMLTGCRIRIQRLRSTGARASIRDKWESWIDSIETTEDAYVVTPMKKHGSPLYRMRLDKNETMHYAIACEPFKDPRVLSLADDLETYLSEQTAYAVGGTVGIADLLKTTNLMSQGLREEARIIPDSADRVDWLWRQYKRIRGQERRRQIVSDKFDKALIPIFLKDANFVATEKLIEKIRAYETEHLAPAGLHISLGGDVAVSQSLIGAIVSTQLRSLLISLVGIGLFTSILHRSLLWGLLTVLPCALAILLNFAVMGWSGMPLGVATSMFAGMTLGIGVDFSIHLLERYRRQRALGRSHTVALTNTMSVAGPAIVIDALGIGLGFGVLVLSQVPANARLGALVAISVIGCLAFSLVLLPSLLTMLFGKHDHDHIDHNNEPRASVRAG